MFAKMFTKMLDSSVWALPDHVVRVWVALLLMADRDGYVWATERGIADRARCRPLGMPEPTDAQRLRLAREALRILEDADLETSTQEYGGARIQRIEGGWFVLNKVKYRDMQTREQQQNASRQRAYQARKKSAEDSALSSVTLSVSESTSDLSQDSATQEDPFARAWAGYPRRAGGNSKQLALKAFLARVRSGVPVDDLVAGVERYAVFVRATGREGTEYVKQASTFFGPAGHWKETWAPPPTNGAAQRPARNERNLNVLADYARRREAEQNGN